MLCKPVGTTGSTAQLQQLSAVCPSEVLGGEVFTVNTGSCSVSNDMVSHPGLTCGSGSLGNISVHIPNPHVRA